MRRNRCLAILVFLLDDVATLGEGRGGVNHGHVCPVSGIRDAAGRAVMVKPSIRRREYPILVAAARPDRGTAGKAAGLAGGCEVPGARAVAQKSH
jgi:hypothetical protein